MHEDGRTRGRTRRGDAEPAFGSSRLFAVEEVQDVLQTAFDRIGRRARVAPFKTIVGDRIGQQVRFRLRERLGANTSAISTEASTRANADGSLAGTISSVSTTVNGQASTISAQASILASVQGRVTTIWQVTSTDANGTAHIALTNANGATSFVIDAANTYVSGNLIVGGTITPGAFNKGSMARNGRSTWNGNVSPSPGSSTDVPFSLTLGPIYPQGRFYFILTVGLTSDYPDGYQYTTTYNGKPYYVHYTAAAGGLFLRSYDNEGNVYTPLGNNTLPVLASTIFNTTFIATLYNTNLDTGIVDEGDYYDRTVAIRYTLTSIDLQATWVAI